MNDNDYGPAYFFNGVLAATLGFILGGVFIFNGYERYIEKKAIKACIEQPKFCKIKYDYYNLKS